MSSRKLVLSALGLVVLGGAWYAFRPERLFVNQAVSESFPVPSEARAMTAAGPMELARGTFHAGAHETRGVAAIFELPGGKRVLRLTDFETSNGPDVHVYLVAARDASDNETVTNAGFVDIGSLKGNVGDQNYDLPDDLDLGKYRAVTIWCKRFGVNFGTSPLQMSGSERARMNDGPSALLAGSFHTVHHDTKGRATIFRLPDGKQVLRLTDFMTSNGPDVQVYLVAAPDAMDNETVTQAGFVPLGALKGNVGDQNYDLPDDVDLSKYRSVTIWCRRFGANFGTAPLAPAQS